MKPKVINIEKGFSKYPAGRYISDGPYSGENFRDNYLIPALNEPNIKVVIELDGARGYGSSFLEEAFGGLIRLGFSEKDILERIDLQTADASLKDEIWQYIHSESMRTEQR